MTTLTTRDEPEAGIDIAGLVLRISAGLVFLALGYLKLIPSTDSMWVATFQRIGLGMWFMTLTGAIQAAGGLLLLIPRTAFVGGLLAAGTMVGAVIAQLAALDGAGGAIFPAGVLTFLIIVVLKVRGR